MRELNELKAEIFRRSEEKIKERQRRRQRIVALCVPLCLCAVIVSALSLPRLFGTKEGDTEKLELSADVAEMAEINGGSEPDAISETEIAVAELRSKVGDVEQYEKITDKERASELYGLIMRMFRTTGTPGDPDGNPETQENREPSDSVVSHSSPAAEYTVTFTGEGGEKAVFYIDGDTVEDINGVSATLSSEVLENLKTALGLSEQ